MPNNKVPKGLIPLAGSVGDFIRYWGFRRIHGQIWSLIYLSSAPLSGTDLGKSLKVSKALVSPAIKELEKHGLIALAEALDSKTKRYVANPDVFQVIKKVLATREKEMLRRVSDHFETLNQSSLGNPTIDPQRLKNLGDMVGSANAFISVLAGIDSTETFKQLALLYCQNDD